MMTSEASPQTFRVVISDLTSGKNKINLNIPLDMVEIGLRMGARFIPDWEPSAYTPVLRAAQAGETGKLVEEISEQNHERIEIFIE